MVTTRSQTVQPSEAPQSSKSVLEGGENGGQTSPVIFNDEQMLALHQISGNPAGSGEWYISDGNQIHTSLQAPFPDGTEEDCLCCADHAQLFEEHNKMIEEHEGHMQEREAEIDGLYARVKGEQRELEQLREEFLEQKSAHSTLLERYAAHFSAREAEMARMHESIRAERAELRQHILRSLQEKRTHSELLHKHEAQVGEAKWLIEQANDLRQTQKAAAQQMDCLREVFQTIWQFVDTRKGSA